MHVLYYHSLLQIMPRSRLSEEDVFIKTIYAEARGECDLGKEWVAWVIKNRARLGNYGGNTIKDVCLADRQFECWNGKDDIEIKEPEAYKDIAKLIKGLGHQDPTGGANHYYNPAKETPNPF